MKIVSWNVAGIRACLKKGLDKFFDEVDADIFCMQEVKAEESQFDFRPKGYTMYLYPASRKGYSGTAIFSRIKPISVRYGIGESEYDEEGRNITLEFKNFYLVNCYVPNVKRDLSRMDSRMRYEEKFLEYIKKLEKKKPVVFSSIADRTLSGNSFLTKPVSLVDVEQFIRTAEDESLFVAEVKDND